MTTNSLEIYYTPHGDIDVQIDYQTDTIWLNKKEIAKLFRIDRSGVSRHINNIFKTGELEQKSNVQINAHCSVSEPERFPRRVAPLVPYGSSEFCRAPVCLPEIFTADWHSARLFLRLR